MAGSFIERSKKLEEEVGEGNLIMGAVVSQPYAAAEHNHLQDKHPRGGMAKYLEIPFAVQRIEMVQHLARNAVTSQGSRLKDAAIEVASKFDDMVRQNAPGPREGFLDQATTYYVRDNGSTYYISQATDPYRWDKE